MFFYRIVSFFAKIIINIMLKIEVIGKENIPKNNESFMMCSNHISNFDPMIISFYLNNKVRYMAKKELFDNKIVGFILKNCGTVPIDRGSGDMDTIKKCIDIISKDKNILGVFPEGKRSKTGEMGRLKSGAIYMAKEAKSDILPVYVKMQNNSYKFRCKYTVTYGKIIPYKTLNLDNDDKRNLKDAKKILEEKIKELITVSEKQNEDI